MSKEFLNNPVLVIVVVFLIGLLIYFIMTGGGNTITEAFRRPPVQAHELPDMTNYEKPMTQVRKMNGNEWGEIIQNRNLIGTGIEDTNRKFVDKVKKRPYMSTPFRHQEFDHIRAIDNHVGLRRSNIHKGTAPAFSSNPKQIFSEYDCDAPIRRTVQIVAPGGSGQACRTLTHPTRQSDQVQDQVNASLVSSSLNRDGEINAGPSYVPA